MINREYLYFLRELFVKYYRLLENIDIVKDTENPTQEQRSVLADAQHTVFHIEQFLMEMITITPISGGINHDI